MFVSKSSCVLLKDESFDDALPISRSVSDMFISDTSNIFSSINLLYLLQSLLFYYC